MALITKGIAGFGENVSIIRTVGIVAFITIAFDHHLMAAAGLFRYDVRVTVLAEFGRAGC